LRWILMATFTWRRCPTRSADDTWSRRGNCAVFLNIDGRHNPFWGRVKFSEIVKEASELLRASGRISYVALQMEFELSDKQLEALKAELIKAKRLAVDEEGEILVWTGDGPPATTGENKKSQAQSPASYTPKHLAERIRAEQAAMEAHGATDGERKTITALFADIQDSTALIEDLDPEAARRSPHGFLRASSTAMSPRAQNPGGTWVSGPSATPCSRRCKR
jgi:hypothetical protein